MKAPAPPPLLALLFLGGWLVFGLAGSAPGAPRSTDVLGGYRPDNIHRPSATLPADLRRVAILPLASRSDSYELGEGRAALEPLLQAELAATKRFEVVRISPERLRARTGRTSWSGDEVLPASFLADLRDEAGCDAVLFCELTLFRGYAPLAVGWRLRLVDVRNGQTLWAADEIFDAAERDVVKAARRFDKNSADGWVILNSPRRFGAYTAAALLATLPQQVPEKAPKVSSQHADDKVKGVTSNRQPAGNELKPYGN